MTIAPTPTKPPKVEGAGPIRAIMDYLWAKFKDDTQVYRLPQRMEDIASLAPLPTTVSNPPTQAEVQAVVNKVNAIISAATRTS